MKNLIGISLVLVASLAATGCGNPITASNNAIKGGELLHTWASECKSSDILDVSMKEYYDFNGALVSLVREYHSQNDCKEAAVRVSYKGNFEVKGGADGMPDGTKVVDMHFDTVLVKPLNESGRSLLDKMDACGQEEWAVNVEVNMTEKSRANLCPLQDAPFANYDIFLVSGDRLQLGKSDAEHAKTTEAGRPNKLDETTYVRENHSFALIASVHAEETLPEKAAVKAKDAKRSVKKNLHRASEALCVQGDAKCEEKKRKHKTTEMKDAVSDKIDEVKNKVD